MAHSSKKLSSQMALEAELKVKSKLLEQSISQFTEATCEIGELERQLAYNRIDGERTPFSSRKARSPLPSRGPYSTPGTTQSRDGTRGPYVCRRASEERPGDLDWAVEESQLAQMRDEVAIYVKEENKRSIAHLQARDDLQESWDKLVKLRTHISFFHAAIEEAKIEEIATEAQGWSATGSPRPLAADMPMYPLQVQTSNLDSAIPPATADDFALISQTPMKDSVQNVDRFVGIYVLREKVQKRDYMRKAVADAERELKLAREKVSNYSEELLSISAASSASVGGSFSSSRGMTLRQRVLEANLELEQAENVYLKNKDALEEFEADLGTALLGVSESVVTELKGMSRQDGEGHIDNADLNLSHFLEQPSQMDDAVSIASTASKPINIGRTSANELLFGPNGQLLQKPEARPVHTFSLQEVLSGQIRISRMNGESASSYKDRLQRRVQAIEPLVIQLKLEVERKAENARQARLDLKDAEVKRLRAELQLSNCESIIREKKEAKQQELLLRQREIEGFDLDLRTPVSFNVGGMSLLDRTRTEENVYNRFHNQLANVEDLQYDIDIHTTSKKRNKNVSISESNRDDAYVRERGWNLSRSARSRSPESQRSRTSPASHGRHANDKQKTQERSARKIGQSSSRTDRSRSRSRSVSRNSPMQVEELDGSATYSEDESPPISAISKSSPSGHAKRPNEQKRSQKSSRNGYVKDNFIKRSKIIKRSDFEDSENQLGASSDNEIPGDGSDNQSIVDHSEGTGVSRRRHKTSAGKISYKLSPTRFKQSAGGSFLRTAFSSKQRLQKKSSDSRDASSTLIPSQAPNGPLHEPSTSWPGSSNYSHYPGMQVPVDDTEDNAKALQGFKSNKIRNNNAKRNSNRREDSAEEAEKRGRQQMKQHNNSRAKVSIPTARSTSRPRSSSAESRGSHALSESSYRRAEDLEEATKVLRKSKNSENMESRDVSDVIAAAEFISDQVSDALHTGTGVGTQRRFRSSRKLRVAHSCDEDDSSRGRSSDRGLSKTRHVRSDGYSSIDEGSSDHRTPAKDKKDVRFSSPGAHSVSTIGNSSATHTILSYPVHNYADSPNHKYTASAIKRRTSADESMARIMEMLNKNQESLDLLNHTQDILKTMLTSPPPGQRLVDMPAKKRVNAPGPVLIPSSPDMPSVAHSKAATQENETDNAHTNKKVVSVTSARRNSKRNTLSTPAKSNKEKKEAELGSPFLKKGVTTPIVRGRPVSKVPSRVQLARKVASLHERRQSRSRSRHHDSNSPSRSASPSKDCGSPSGCTFERSSLMDLERELAQGIEPEPFEFDKRPKPFHRIQERLDHETLAKTSQGQGATGGSPRSILTTSPPAESTDEISDAASSPRAAPTVDRSPEADRLPKEIQEPINIEEPFTVLSEEEQRDKAGTEHDVVELYQQKHQLLNQILSSGTGNDSVSNPAKEHVSVGVDTSGLHTREAGWLWSPNSKGKDKLSREQEMNDRINLYQRNRSTLSPSRSPSPFRIALAKDNVVQKENRGRTSVKSKDVTPGRKPLNPTNLANVASVNMTAANVKSHILVEQKKLEKCIIKLSNLKDIREKHKARLQELKAKKRLDRQQMHGSHESVNERSSVALKITVLAARNLPEMKRQKHSADPYVELWVTSPPSSDQADSGAQEVGGITMERHTTTIKWGMLFPLWEESFDFTIPCDISGQPSNSYDEGTIGNGSGGHVAISDDCLRIVLRDAVKSDIATNEAANIQSIIGECFLNFDTLLDQKVHTCWLPVIDTVVATPELHHLTRSRHKIPSDCALKVESRLLYSKEILLRNKIAESDKQISRLSIFIDACSNELLELAYGWEQMQQKQMKLNSLTLGAQQPPKAAHQHQPKKRLRPNAAVETKVRASVRSAKGPSGPTAKPESIDDIASSPENSALHQEAGAGNDLSPMVLLERRDNEDLLLLARSNSRYEVEETDVILPVSKNGFISVDGITSSSVTTTHEREAQKQQGPMLKSKAPISQAISFDDFIKQGQSTNVQTQPVRAQTESSNTNEKEDEGCAGHRANGSSGSYSPSRTPNMAIFHGAGGGRNPPRQPFRVVKKPVTKDKKRWM